MSALRRENHNPLTLEPMTGLKKRISMASRRASKVRCLGCQRLERRLPSGRGQPFWARNEAGCQCQVVPSPALCGGVGKDDALAFAHRGGMGMRWREPAKRQPVSGATRSVTGTLVTVVGASGTTSDRSGPIRSGLASRARCALNPDRQERCFVCWVSDPQNGRPTARWWWRMRPDHANGSAHHGLA